MATVQYQNLTYLSVEWRLYGLSNNWDDNFYLSGGVSQYPVASGASNLNGCGYYITIDPPTSGTTTYSPWQSFTHGGIYGDTFTMYGFVKAVNGLYYPSGSMSFDIPYPPTPIPSSPVSITARLEGGFELTWGASSGALEYEVKVTTYAGTTYYPADSRYLMIDGLEFSVSHTFSVRATNGNNWSNYTATSIGTTNPQTPTISQGTVLSDSIRINTGAISGAYDNIQVSIYTSGGSLISTQNASESSYTTFTGLTPNTAYRFRARTMSTASGSTLYSVSYTSYLNISTTPALAPFVWSPSITQGGNIGITAAQFLLFQSAINECRLAYSMATYSFTTSSTYIASGKDIMAFLYVQCATAIDDINGQVDNSLLATSAGDDVTAYHWTNITTALNNAINAL